MHTPLPSYLDVIAIPASWIYGKIVSIRNRYYDKEKNVKKVPLPVIAVGNLTVGGTGKTPLVTWIVRHLREKGYNPAIVMRGYASINPEFADEAVEYREKIQNIDVIVGGDRFAQIDAYIKDGGKADCLVMDDGFQHRKLHRDLDIVVLDFLRNVFDQKMLPAGWLREPISGLKRSDAVVVSHAQRSDPTFANAVQQATGSEPIAWTAHHWELLHVIDSDGEREEPLGWLTGKSVAVRLGIGSPQPVIEALVRLGAKVATQLPAGDHQPFSNTELALLIEASSKVDAVVMTHKDWVKARDAIDLKKMQCPVVIPKLVLDVIEGGKNLESLLISVFDI
jgi:tetraacyldisaccharide 4'-kinase